MENNKKHEQHTEQKQQQTKEFKNEIKAQKEVKQDQPKKETKHEKEFLELSEKYAQVCVELNDKNKLIENLKNQVEKINNEYMTKVKEKAVQAQTLVDQKIKELQLKFEAEAKENKKYALSDSIKEFISILNQLENAINAPINDEKVKNYLKGLNMFITLIHNWLKSLNINKIEITHGMEFDPQYMEAIEAEKDENSTQPFRVSKVIEAGYKLFDRVVVFAKVNVTNKPIN